MGAKQLKIYARFAFGKFRLKEHTMALKTKSSKTWEANKQIEAVFCFKAG